MRFGRCYTRASKENRPVNDHIAPELRPLAVPISDIALDPRNARKHGEKNLAAIRASLERFGQRKPVVVQREGMIVRAGNGTVEAARSLGWTHIAAVVSDDDDQTATAFALADNRSAELAEWDDEALAELVSELDADMLNAIGFDAEDVSALEARTNPAEVVEDEAPAAPRTPVSRMGDLWCLGQHRLLCGDSTNEADVVLVMNGERAALMNTDAPYGISYDNAALGPNRKDYSSIANDELSDERLQAFLELAFRAAKDHALKDNAAWYMWHAHLTQGYFAAAAAAAGVILHRQIIWVKDRLILGRGMYHWKHEPCFMGWVDGHRPPDYGEGDGERTQTTAWEIKGVGVTDRREFEHATPKPIALFAIPVVKHTLKGEVCYEPFSGSGPQIIACEQLDRRCFAIEIAPEYVDVAIKRWQRLTGEQATLDGKPWSEVAEERGVAVD